MPGKTLSEFAAVADFVVREMQRADEAWPRRAKRRLVRGAFRGRQRPTAQPVLAEQLARVDRRIQGLIAAIDLEDPARAAIVVDCYVRDDLVQRVEAVVAELQVGESYFSGIGPPRSCAGRRCPTSTCPAVPHPQQQRRLLVAEPAKDLRRHARPRPCLRFADMDDSAVAKAGLERRIGAPLDDDDFAPALPQKVSSRRADNAGADDDCFHKPISSRYSTEPGEASREHRKHSCGTRSAPCIGQE